LFRARLRDNKSFAYAPVKVTAIEGPQRQADTEVDTIYIMGTLLAGEWKEEGYDSSNSHKSDNMTEPLLLQRVQLHNPEVLPFLLATDLQWKALSHDIIATNSLNIYPALRYSNFAMNAPFSSSFSSESFSSSSSSIKMIEKVGGRGRCIDFQATVGSSVLLSTRLSQGSESAHVRCIIERIEYSDDLSSTSSSSSSPSSFSPSSSSSSSSSPSSFQHITSPKRILFSSANGRFMLSVSDIATLLVNKHINKLTSDIANTTRAQTKNTYANTYSHTNRS